MTLLRHILTLSTLFALSTGPALAAPQLKSEVMVSSAVVTVGDMFDDAGLYAEQALFRAPAPGTSGMVDVEAVRTAAAKVGLTEFGTDGILAVRVARDATFIDETALTTLIAQDLQARGILTTGMSADALFDTPFGGVNAEAVEQPVTLSNLRYLPGNGAFTARFIFAGIDKPLDVSGRIDLMIEAPHLSRTLPAGTVLTDTDIVMRLVPLKYAETAGIVDYSGLIGKSLQHQSREGMLLKASDVGEPQLISRNDVVTLYFKSGGLTLTVKGKALNNAVKGGTVAVLNAMSNRVVNGIAVSAGTVEIAHTAMTVAGL